MKITRTHSIAAALSLCLCGLAPLSCAGEIDPNPAAPAAPAAAAPSQESAAAVALRIEQAERKLDLGRDLPEARQALSLALKDPAATPALRDQAKLGLSRVSEAEGDLEAATAAIEALLAEHGDSQLPVEVRARSLGEVESLSDDQPWPLREAAEKRLRKLVTGSEAEPPSFKLEEPQKASPFAFALSAYYPKPEASRREINISMLAFGGSNEVSKQLGTFAIGRAIGELRRKACPTCDENLRVNTSSSHTSGWIGIPKNRARLASSLAIFYFDLASQRIPARYDAELPIPSAEIIAHLSRGSGLVAVREREGAPPAILIAAPRQALFPAVEAALAAMKSVPKEPVVVSLSQSLTAAEIQTVVRGAFPTYRACYEELLGRNPTAAGSIPLKFTVQSDGSVSALQIDAAATLHDATFDQCMVATTSPLVFPSAPSPSTVTYPIAFAPGE
jgi:hypothetical protein